MFATNAFFMATIREAMARGKLADGGYGNDEPGRDNQNPPAMVLVIEP